MGRRLPGPRGAAPFRRRERRSAPSPARRRRPPPASVHESGLADHTELIREVLLAREGKRIYIDTLTPKKERDVRAHILPEEARNETLVAVLDLTIMGSCKDALVFTATHCYAREIDSRVAFPPADLADLAGLAGKLRDKIEVHVEGVGRLRVPCSTRGTVTLEILRSIVAHGSS